MASRKTDIVFFSGLGVIFVALVFFGSHVKTAICAEVPPLTNSQCVHCHPLQPETIEAQGAKHKTEIGCQDCHVEHPPLGANAVPECSMCHSGEPHYDLKGCSSCHSDAHAPLDIKLEGDLTGPCLTCHQPQGEELKKYPSAHAEVPCTQCHTAHRMIPECMVCHEKHTEDMEFKTCLSCHPVHMPLEITYGRETPSHYCTACHEKAGALLQANKTKHHDLSCAYCHQDKHKTVPPCTMCHGKPHPDAMLKKFPSCGKCHSTAHDLR